MNCVFNVKYDPDTKEPYTEKINLSQFKEIKCSDNTYLFKLAAKDSIEKNENLIPES